MGTDQGKIPNRRERKAKPTTPARARSEVEEVMAKGTAQPEP
jgi:hypothetical protein